MRHCKGVGNKKNRKGKEGDGLAESDLVLRVRRPYFVNNQNNKKMQSFEIIRGQGGVPKDLAGRDHICGMLFFLPDDQLNQVSGSMVRAFASYEDAFAAYGAQAGAGFKVALYHIKELFRIQPAAKVWVKFASCGESSPYGDSDLKAVKDLQVASGGECRQIGVWNGYSQGTIADVKLLQEAAGELDKAGTPCSILYAAGGTTTAWANPAGEFKRTDGCSNVSWVIGQDLTVGGKAAELAAASEAPAISALGAALGCVAKAAVNESIAWVSKFNVGYEAVGFCDNKSNAEVGSANLDTLDTKGFIYLTTYDGLAGSYWQDSHTMDLATSDYNSIEAERSIDKACRGVRTYLLPYLGSPVYLNSDGTLRADSLAVLKTVASQALEQMERAGELSGFAVEIDPSQNILANSTLEFVIKNVAVGVMRNIKVKIGYTTSID